MDAADHHRRATRPCAPNDPNAIAAEGRLRIDLVQEPVGRREYESPNETGWICIALDYVNQAGVVYAAALSIDHSFTRSPRSRLAARRGPGQNEAVGELICGPVEVRHQFDPESSAEK